MIHHLPLYGNITSISSAGTSKLAALCFDLESNTHIAHFIDLQAVFDAADQTIKEKGVQSHTLSQAAIECLSSSKHEYVVTETDLYIHEDNALKSIHTFSQKPSHASICENDDVIVVLNATELLVLQKDGTSKQNITLTEKVTALAVSADGNTFAVGYQTGFVEVFKRNGGAFASVVKDEQSAGSNPLEMHKDSAVCALSILRYEDNRDWLLSFGADRTAMQAHTEELIASERATSGLHNGIVSSIISPVSLNKVYTLAKDGEAKSWRRTQSKYPPATVDIIPSATSCALVRFPVKDTNANQMVDAKFLAIAGGEEADHSIQFWSFDQEDSDNLLGNEHEIQMGKNWIDHFSDSRDEQRHKHIITTISGWNVRFFDSLVQYAKNKNISQNNQSLAVEKIAASGLSASSFKLAEIVQKAPSRQTQVEALEKYAQIDSSLAPIECGLMCKTAEIHEKTIALLKEKASNNEEARKTLEDVVRNSPWNENKEKYAKDAFEALYSIASSIETVLLGIENPQIDSHAIEEIFRKGHVHEPKAQAQLMQLLRNTNESTRTLARNVLLLENPSLAQFARSEDEMLHHALCSIEAPTEPNTDQPSDIDASSVDQSALILLDEMMAAPHDDIASYAAMLSTKLGSPNTIAPALMFMSSDNVLVRRNATNSLCLLGSQQSNAGLIKAFCTDSDTTIRQQAFEGVQLSNIEKIRHALVSQYGDIRQKSLELLNKEIENGITPELKQLLHRSLLNEHHGDVAKGCFMLFMKHPIIGDKAETLSYTLTCSHLLVRELARVEVSSMLQNKVTGALDLAQKGLLLEDDNEAASWFNSACQALSKDQVTRTEFVRHAMQHKNLLVRSQAFQYLYKNPKMDLSAHIIAAISNSPAQAIRNEIYKAGMQRWETLKANTDKGAIDTEASNAFAAEFFSAAITSSVEAEREGVLRSFSASEDGWRLNILVQALKDPSPKIRALAASMLSKMGGSGYAYLLESNELEVRLRAARELARLGDERAIKPLHETLTIAPPSKDADEYKVNSVFATEKFNHDMKQWHTHTIWALTSAMKLRSAELLPAVRNIINDPQELYPQDVRIEAIHSLGSIATKDSKEDVTLLQGVLGSQNKGVSKQAALTLARMGNIQGMDAAWNSIGSKEKFELLVSFGDQAYILRAFAENDDYVCELIIALVLQAMYKGGSLSFLADALTAPNKKAVLLSARLLQHAGDTNALLQQLQQELNEWHPLQLNLIREAELSSNYFGFAEYLNAYYSFQNLTETKDRRRKIEITSWSLLAQLLAHNDAIIRTLAAALIYDYQKGSIDDNTFLDRLTLLADRNLATPIAPVAITIDEKIASTMAFGAYRNLASSQTNISIRKEALYSYVAGKEHGVNTKSITSLLEQLLLDKALSTSAYGYLSKHQDLLPSGIDIFEIGLRTKILSTQKMALALLIQAGKVDSIRSLAKDETEAIAQEAFSQLLEMYNTTRLENLWNALKTNRNRNHVHPQDWRITINQFHSDQVMVNMAKEHTFTNNLCEFAHKNQDVQQQVDALKTQYSQQREALFSDMLHSANKKVQEQVINHYINAHRTESRKEAPDNNLLASYNESLNDALKTPYKSLRHRALIALGNQAYLGITEQLLSLVQTATDTTFQNQIYNALVQLAKAHRSEAQKLPEALKNVAPTLCARWFDDPTGTAVVSSIVNTLQELNDPKILPSLLNRLHTHGYDAQLYDLCYHLTGYENTPGLDWENYTAEEKHKYEQIDYDSESIVKMLRFDLAQSSWNRIRHMIWNVRNSKESDDPSILFAVENLLRLPKGEETNSVVLDVLSILKDRVEYRSKTDTDDFRSQVQDALIPILESKDKDRAFRAAELLALLKNAAGMNLLLQKAGDVADSDIQGREAAFHALANIANQACWVFFLLYAGFTEHFEPRPEEEMLTIRPEIRAAALHALGSMHKSKSADEVLSILRTKLYSEDKTEQVGAVQGIGLFGPKGEEICKEEYENIDSRSYDVRLYMMDILRDNPSNYDFLLSKLAFEIEEAAGYEWDLNNYLEEMKPNNIDAARIFFPHIVKNDPYGTNNKDLLERILIFAEEQEIVEKAEYAFKRGAYTIGRKYLDLLTNEAEQKRIERLSTVYPTEFILERVAANIDSEHYDFVEGLLPLPGAPTGNVVQAIQKAEEKWTSLYQKQKEGRDVSYEINRVEHIWVSLLGYGGDYAQPFIAQLFVRNNLPDSLFSFAIQHIKASEGMVADISKLLSSPKRELRTTAAALLQNFAVSETSAVSEDPAALFLLRRESTSSLLETARNGSVSAISNIARSDSWAQLEGILCDAQAQESVRVATARSLAQLGTKEANALLKKAASSEDSLQDEMQKALSLGQRRQKKNETFAAKSNRK